MSVMAIYRQLTIVSGGPTNHPRTAASRTQRVGIILRMARKSSFLADTPQHRGIWRISIPRIFPVSHPQAEPRVKFECWIEGSTVRIRTWDAKQIEVHLGPTGLNLPG